MVIRKAGSADIESVRHIYDEVHVAAEKGRVVTGWIKNVYPTRATAEAALQRGDLFVLEDEGGISGTGIINQIQVDSYEGAPWKHDVPPEHVCVLHTLVISPRRSGRGYGSAFVRYYEDYARTHGCMELRMDTNARNRAARQLYAKLGYKEIGIVSTVFNGIPGVQLVLLEKHL